MSTVLLIIHTMITLALIGVVLLQRSEGGALGIGGGGSGGFMTGRSAANFLTRATAGLAAAMFATSLLLSIIATHSAGPRSILDTPAGTQQAPGPKKQSPLPDLNLNMPNGAPSETPQVPQSK